jgi:excisionase family DNA binding protein
VSVVPDDVESLAWAAERLHIGLSTAYRLAKAGKLQGVFRVGTQYRVSVPAFMEAVHGSSA